MKYSKPLLTAAGALLAGVSLCINADTIVPLAGPVQDVASQGAGTEKSRPWTPLTSDYRNPGSINPRADASGCVPGAQGWGWLGERGRSSAAPGAERLRGQVYQF